MRLGLIGTGRIGTFHAGILQQVAGVESIVVTDADIAKARELDRTMGVDSVPDVDAMYDVGVDGVVITAATSAHAGLIHQALDEGVPVFCEKPVGIGIDATLGVVQRESEADVPLQVGFQRRFDAGYRAAREALRAGSLGWVHTMRAVTADASPPPAAYLPTSGGLFRDCGNHDFDIMRWLTGREVTSVHAWGVNRGDAFFTEAGDVDTYIANLRFDDDMLATVTATRYNGAGHDVRVEVCGSERALFVGLDDRAPMPTAEQSLSWRQGPAYATFLERFNDAYAAELIHFVDVVGGDAETPCTAADSLEALYVAEACVRSHETGQTVDVADVRR